MLPLAVSPLSACRLLFAVWRFPLACLTNYRGAAYPAAACQFFTADPDSMTAARDLRGGLLL
jgi:hypothetical protein